MRTATLLGWSLTASSMSASPLVHSFMPSCALPDWNSRPDWNTRTAPRQTSASACLGSAFRRSSQVFSPLASRSGSPLNPAKMSSRTAWSNRSGSAADSPTTPASPVVALHPHDDRLADLVHADRLGRLGLAVALDGGDVQLAVAGLVHAPLAVHVLQVRPGLGERLEGGGDAARLVLDGGVVDVDPLHFKAHGSGPPR